jgi:hypothetical protein
MVLKGMYSLSHTILLQCLDSNWSLTTTRPLSLYHHHEILVKYFNWRRPFGKPNVQQSEFCDSNKQIMASLCKNLPNY